MKIAVFSAFPQELSHIRKDSVSADGPPGRAFPISLKIYREAELIAVETGMSIPRIESVFKYVLCEHRPDIVLSCGFGGALYYRADIGDLVLASRYFFMTREGAIELPQLSARATHFQRSLWNGPITTRLQKKVAVKEGSFLTLSQWAAKSKLRKEIPRDAEYPVCDRETLHLARLAYTANLPFFAIRAITDRVDEDIPEELFQVTDENGMYSLSRSLSLLLSRPSLIPDSLALGRHAAIAAKSLGEAVKALAEVVGSSRMAMRSFLTGRAGRSEARSGKREDR
ncbi:MAG: hypothetical protein A2078_01955, partial [Nitrospirae bacterium GWC2_57_9]